MPSAMALVQVRIGLFNKWWTPTISSALWMPMWRIFFPQLLNLRELGYYDQSSME